MRSRKCPKKILFICLSLFFCLFSCVSFSTSASAISFRSSWTVAPTSEASFAGYNIYNPGNSSNYPHLNTSFAGQVIGTSRAGQEMTIFRIVIGNSELSGGAYDAPRLISGSFYVQAQKNSNNNPTIEVISVAGDNQFGTYTELLDYSCAKDEMENAYSEVTTIRCNYLVYQTYSDYRILLSTNINAYSDQTFNLQVLAGPMTVTPISFDSLSTSDRQFLSTEISDAVEQGQKAANEDVKNQTQTQSNTSAGTANSEGSDSSTQGQTLLQAFSGFVNAITSATPYSDCQFPADLRAYNPGLYAMIDLCSLDVPQPLQVLGSILLILFVVPLSLATVRRMIGLFRSFQT